MRLDLAAGDQNQQRDDRYRRGDGRERRISKRIIDLIPHYISSPRAYVAYRPAWTVGYAWRDCGGVFSKARNRTRIWSRQLRSQAREASRPPPLAIVTMLGLTQK